MKTAIRKLLVGVAGLVIESLSVSKEQVAAQRQQSAALHHVHQAERAFYMVSQSGTTEAIEAARQEVSDARSAFDKLYSKPLQ